MRWRYRTHEDVIINTATGQEKRRINTTGIRAHDGAPDVRAAHRPRLPSRVRLLGALAALTLVAPSLQAHPAHADGFNSVHFEWGFFLHMPRASVYPGGCGLPMVNVGTNIGGYEYVPANQPITFIVPISWGIDPAPPVTGPPTHPTLWYNTTGANARYNPAHAVAGSMCASGTTSYGVPYRMYEFIVPGFPAGTGVNGNMSVTDDQGRQYWFDATGYDWSYASNTTAVSPQSVAPGSTATVDYTGQYVDSTCQLYFNSTALTTTSNSSTDLSATVPATLTGSGQVADLSAHCATFTAGPRPFYVMGNGVTLVEVNSATNPDPAGTITPSVGGTGPGTAGSVSASASGTGTISVAKLSGDSTGTAPAGASNFFDVHSPDVTNATVTTADLGTTSTPGKSVWVFNMPGYLGAWSKALNQTATNGSISFPAGSANGVPLSGTIFAVVPDSGPTAARIGRFSVTQHGAQLAAQWRMNSSSGVAGFALYAGDHRINRQLIQTHVSRAYRYTVQWSGHGRIALHVLLRSGGSIVVLSK